MTSKIIVLCYTVVMFLKIVKVQNVLTNFVTFGHGTQYKIYVKIHLRIYEP